MGLQCCHSLIQNVSNNQPIHPQQIHPHWRFDTHIGPEPSPLTLQRLLAEEPMVIESARGRPQGQREDNTTRRNPSFFERVDDFNSVTNPQVANTGGNKRPGRPKGSKNKNPRQTKRQKTINSNEVRNVSGPVAASQLVADALRETAPRTAPMTLEEL